MPFSDFILRNKLLAQGVNPSTGAGGPSTPGGAPAAPGLFSGLLGAAFPTGDATGLIDPAQQRAAQQQGLLGLGSSLLQQSGPQPGPRIGLGAALGNALQAGQGAATGSINNQLQAMLLKSRIAENERQAAAQNQDPAKVREYQFAKQNGFVGSYEDFLKIGQGAVGNFNPGDYTPDSFAKFQKTGNTADLRRYVAPAQPSVQVVNGVPTVVQASRTGGATAQSPLTTLDATTTAEQAIKAAQARGTATGAAEGGALGAIQKKGIEASSALRLIDQAEPLIDVATGSGIGEGVDKFVGLFGFAPTSAQAAASLKVLGANLVTTLPRLEGPQSDRDTQLYKEAAAQIGNPSVPADIKRAALATVRRIQEEYRDQFQGSGGQSGPPDISGTKPTAKRPPLASFRKP